MSNTWIVIPAYQPSNSLITLIDQLLQKQLNHIVVVNDGSDAFCNFVFQNIKNKNIVLLNHSKNQGKGAALKTAFRYLIENAGDFIGVVTADADGQHLANDIAMMVNELIQNPQHFQLGLRTFDANIPKRSYFGNVLTQKIFYRLYKKKVNDTQTGLRGIPISLLPLLCQIKSNGYGFELEMLIVAAKRGVVFDEHPIKTVYIDENKNSHFNPIVDSVKVYWVFIRYLFDK